MDQSLITGALSEHGFTVTRKLDDNANSKIFCVQEAATPTQLYVAKVISLTGLDAKGRAITQQEVSVLRGLAAHPNLIAYRDSFYEDAARVLLIVMTLAEDGDLRGAISNSLALARPLPVPVVISWLRQTLSGLNHLHSQSVVHRDLKSSNIFLCDARRRILIGDFGISRVLESTAFASTCVGTPAYMSPELMRNERYDYHVDMWAAGCILFELSTLKLPFASKSLLGLVFEVTESEPDWSQLSAYSPELTDIAQRILRKNAEERPTAAQLLAEPFFAAGGQGAQEPSEEVWARVPGKAGVDAGAGLAAQAAAPLAEDQFARELEQARASHGQFSKDEFQQFLTTHHGTLVNELRGGAPASASEVPETII